MEYLSQIKKVHGPYTRKDGRQHVCIILLDGTRLTRSYPKYLKEVELGRSLDPLEETIDHKDRNFKNDSPENLQIMTRGENAAKSAERRKEVFDNCVFCGKEFKLSVSQVRNRCRGKAGPFCSRSCVGKYGKGVQGGEKTLPPNEIVVSYYRLDD